MIILQPVYDGDALKDIILQAQAIDMSYIATLSRFEVLTFQSCTARESPSPLANQFQDLIVQLPRLDSLELEWRDGNLTSPELLLDFQAFQAYRVSPCTTGHLMMHRPTLSNTS